MSPLANANDHNTTTDGWIDGLIHGTIDWVRQESTAAHVKFKRRYDAESALKTGAKPLGASLGVSLTFSWQASSSSSSSSSSISPSTPKSPASAGGVGGSSGALSSSAAVGRRNSDRGRDDDDDEQDDDDEDDSEILYDD